MNADASIPHFIDDLDTPALLIESSILERNLDRMQTLADRHNLKLRPHVKTHKCIALAKRQMSLGAVGIAVAKLGEAEIMAEGGLADIQIANQVVGRLKLDRFRRLAGTVTLSCAVDSVEQIDALADRFSPSEPANVFIEFNTGLNRAGVCTAEDALILAQRISSHRQLKLAGLLTHAGHAYAAETPLDLDRIGKGEGEQLVRVADFIRRAGIEVQTISVGSTPTAPFAAAVPGVTELRVGNYIFNDMTQVTLEVAAPEECALTVLATVTSRPSKDRAIVDAGAKALALDRGAHGSSRLAGYGQLVGYDGTISRLSEEHGIIESTDPRLKVGERVRIVPNHACPVVNLFEKMYLVDGDRIIESLSVDARGAMQ